MRPGDLLGPTTMRLACRVAGCGEAFEVPVQYRLTYLEGVGARVELDVDGTLALEAPLRVHLDEHAMNTENAALVWTPGDPVGERSTLGVLDPSVGTPRSPYTVAGDW